MSKGVNIGRTLIIGDSYSTFEGYIPEGYAHWYQDGANGLAGVDGTWWRILFSKIECELVRNDSWSGTTVCHTGYDGKDVSDRSFITRTRKLFKDGFFERERIDTVLVFGGTNDSWAGVPLGEFKLDGASEEELYSILPAIPYFTRMLREGLPTSRIIFIVNPLIREEIRNAFAASANHFGCEVIHLTPLDVINNHPSDKGMREIAEQVLKYLNAK